MYITQTHEEESGCDITAQFNLITLFQPVLNKSKLFEYLTTSLK